MIKHIKTSDLRRMQNQEGLILQGCGGSLQEWVDGINQMLTEWNNENELMSEEEMEAFLTNGNIGMGGM